MSETKTCPVCGEASFEDQKECLLHCPKDYWYQEDVTPEEIEKKERTFWLALQRSYGLQTIYDDHVPELIQLQNDFTHIQSKHTLRSVSKDRDYCKEVIQLISHTIGDNKYATDWQSICESILTHEKGNKDQELLSKRDELNTTLEEISNRLQIQLSGRISIVNISFPEFGSFEPFIQNNFSLLGVISSNSTTGGNLAPHIQVSFSFSDCIFYNNSAFVNLHQKTQDQNATLELAFDNCHFHGDIEVTQGENIETRFTNKCVFDKNTLIKNSSNKASKAVFYQATFNGFTQFTIPTLELENCIFNNNISSIQSNCKSRLCHFNAPIESIKGSFHDEGSTFQADITLNASNSSEHKLTNSKFNDQVTNISEKAKVEFNKCTISDLQYCHSGNKLIIKGGSARKIDIRAGENSKNNFYNIDIHIDSIETLSIRNFKHDPTRPYSESISEISPNIRIKKCSNYIFIYNTAITNGFKLIVDETKGLLFHKSLFFSESVLMISKVNSQLSFNHCTLGNNLLITSESINESAVNTLLLRHIKLTDTAEVVIKNIKIDNLYFNEVLNYSKFFKFSNISINDVLKIEDSLIPELYLSGVSITDQCMEITFSDTSFMNVSFNNVIWPKNLEKIFNTEVAPESNRDTCRQLKKVLENQGNIIDSNRFYALEMKAYGKMLPKSWFTKHIRDKFIFWLGEKTSNFAQDWTKPIYWMLMLACYNLLFSAVVKCEHLQLLNKTFALSSATVMPLLLIILLIYGLKKIPEPVYSLLTLATIVGVTFGIYGYTFVSENFFTSYILYPLERLLAVFNPLDKKSTEGHPILWFFSKAIFAFLIYQFVVATRRQTKR